MLEKFKFIAAILLFLLPTVIFAQKKKGKCNEGCAPSVSMFTLKGDSLLPLNFFIMDKENRIRIILEGGIENVKHTMFVTSKNAEVIPVSGKVGDFIVIPHKDEVCEIIVDVKTFENYYYVKTVEKDGKKVKEIVRTYHPRTYMVGFEKIEVR